MVFTFVLLLFTWQGGAWATPAQNPHRQTVPVPGPNQVVVTCCPEAQTTLTSPTGDVTITIPQGAVDECIHLVYTSYTVSEAPDAGTGFRLLGHVFTLEAYLGLTRIPGYVFLKPLEVCITYTDEDVAQAGGDPNNMVIQVAYDASPTEWGDLETTIDTEAKTACAFVSHLSWFALVAPVPGELPVTGTKWWATLFPIQFAVVVTVSLVVFIAGWIYLRRS